LPPGGSGSIVLAPAVMGGARIHHATMTCDHGVTEHDIFGSPELMRDQRYGLWATHVIRTRCGCKLGTFELTPHEES
jgi:hypothetical protein